MQGSSLLFADTLVAASAWIDTAMQNGTAQANVITAQMQDLAAANEGYPSVVAEPLARLQRNFNILQNDLSAFLELKTEIADLLDAGEAATALLNVFYQVAGASGGQFALKALFNWRQFTGNQDILRLYADATVSKDTKDALVREIFAGVSPDLRARLLIFFLARQ